MSGASPKNPKAVKNKMFEDAATIKEAYTKGAAMLEAAGVADAVRDSRTLLALAMDVSENRLILGQQSPVSPDRLRVYERMVQRRASGEPLQHITGNTEFMGLPFVVRPGVLIPRRETEIMVEKALEIIKSDSWPEGRVRILDLCCGSGVIGISIARLAQASDGSAADIEVTCADISTDCVYLAHTNAELNGVDRNMRFVRGDMAAPFAGRADDPADASVIFGMVCCNPPYIPTEVIGTLQREVRDHDPTLALDGGYDGLDFYRRIACEVPEVMASGGTLILEIGSEQREAVTEILTESGNFDKAECVKDLAGLDRVIMAVRK